MTSFVEKHFKSSGNVGVQAHDEHVVGLLP